MLNVLVFLLKLLSLSSTLQSVFAWMTMTTNNPKILGICGGIGSGKSCASRLLVEQLSCWQHLEADRMAHAVYAVGSSAVDDIAKEFGPSVLQENGEINRVVLGGIVFSDPTKMTALEHIVWPYVRQEIIAAIDNKGKETLPQDMHHIIVLEAAVLIDAGWEDLLDGLWVISVKPETALQRLMEQRGLTKEEAETRIQAQQSRRGIGNLEDEVKKGIVTKVINNDGDLESLMIKLQAALCDPSAWSS